MNLDEKQRRRLQAWRRKASLYPREQREQPRNIRAINAALAADAHRTPESFRRVAK